jgi:phage terminase large subunit-like protein
MLPWQEEIIRDVFGTLKKDGYRRYNTAYIEIPKKNGKSELAAAVALYLLCADGEWAAEVYGCASDRQQASVVFDVAVDMVDQNPDLRKLIKPVLSIKRLVYLPQKSFYQVCSSEAYTKHGLNVHGVVFDELHAQPNRELHDVMTKGSGDARMQPLNFEITTAGDDPDRTSIGWEIHKKALDVINGTKTIPNFYAKIYGVEDNADWTDEKLWLKANPSIGHNLRIDTIRDAFEEARQCESDERLFRQLRLNQWVTTKLSKWVSLDIWDKNGGEIDLSSLVGRKCYGGLDLSSKLDMTSFALVFPPETEDGQFIVLPHYWIPEDGLRERVKKDYVPYDKWRNAGLLETTPGNAIDYRYIKKTILDLRNTYDILEVGFDPWNAQQTANELADENIECIEVSQNYKSMTPALNDLEALLKSQKINHGDNEILRWNFGNIEVKVNEYGNIRPVKNKAGDRIDGVIAMIIALIRALNAEDSTSVYEERGVVSF